MDEFIDNLRAEIQEYADEEEFNVGELDDFQSEIEQAISDVFDELIELRTAVPYG